MLTLAACLLIFIGSLVQYTIGFGLAVIAAPLLPAALFGAWLARRYGKKIPQQWMRHFSLALCSLWWQRNLGLFLGTLNHHWPSNKSSPTR